VTLGFSGDVQAKTSQKSSSQIVLISITVIGHWLELIEGKTSRLTPDAQV
jgi:hypothetical protein